MLTDTSGNDDNLPEIIWEYIEMLKSTYITESAGYSSCNFMNSRWFYNTIKQSNYRNYHDIFPYF